MKNYLSLVKFSHTVFALPFAMLGYFIAINQPGRQFDWHLLVLVLLCMVFARNSAMAFNRFLDREIDSKNPRTAVREIPTGVISPRAALVFVLINVGLFVATTWFINPLCFMLSPVALLIVLGYSYTKRFTWLCHFVLGLGLSLAPIGAYLSVNGRFDWLPLLYSGVVLFWVSGFDMIYALQDEEFDKTNALYSIPAFVGKGSALRISELCHIVSAASLVAGGIVLQGQHSSVSLLHWLGVALFLGLLLYQHTLVKPHDLSRVNLAFFTTNGIASIVFCGLVILDFYI
jgi:4-hydroxybenzoate polyprenyltransferase